MTYSSHTWPQVLTSLALSFGLAVAIPAAAAAQGTTAAAASTWAVPEAPAYHQEMRSRASSLLSLAPVLDTDDVTAWMTIDDEHAFRTRSVSLIKHPIARTIARYQLLRFYLQSSQYDRAASVADTLGFVENWKLAGPFPSEGMSGATTAFAPETDGFTGDDQRFAGKVVEIGWLEAPEATESGYYRLSSWIASDDQATTYGLVECQFTQTQATMEAAVDGAYRLWINGVPSVEQPDNLGGSVVRDLAPVTVQKGWNTLLLKVTSDGYSPGWHLRFTDGKGNSVIEGCRSVESAVPPVQATNDFAVPNTLAGLLDAEAAKGKWTANDYAAAAFILYVLQPEDPREPWAHFDEKATIEALSPLALLRLASTRKELWSRMRVAERALTPQASVIVRASVIGAQRAQLSLRAHDQMRVAFESLQRAAPNDPRVRWRGANIDLDYDMHDRALVTLQELSRTFGDVGALCHDGPRLLRALGDVRGSIAASDACYQRRGGTKDAQLARARQLIQQSRAAEVDALLADGDERWEASADWHLARVGIETLRGDKASALQHLERAAALRPNHADTHMLIAAIQLEMSHAAAATASLETVLQLRPQSTLARELLREVQQDRNSFYAQWRLPLETLSQHRARLPREGQDYGRVADQRVVHVYPNGLATTYIQQSYDAYTRNGADMLRSMTIGYSPDSEIVEVLAAQILRPDGSIREAYTARDLRPYSGASSIYYDVRTRQLSFPALQQGDLLNVEYTISDVAYRNLFDDYFGDVWFYDSYAPTAFARYVIESPSARQMYANVGEGEGGMTVTRQEDMVTRVFERRDLAPLERESRAPGAAERFGHVHISTYRDWDALAKWYWNLIRDQLTTSPEMIATVRELTAGVSDRRQKVANIYEYVVRNTRYVGLEFGIHGFKPYRTTECFNRRFGDCKDTASLIKVMLEIAGIESNLVLIRRRDLGRLTDGIASLAVFNHAIAYVPEFDLYLDGTAGYSGSSETPTMDQGGSALIVLDGRGGRAVTVPYLSAEEAVSQTTITMDARNPDAKGSIEWRFVGGSASSLRQSLEAAERHETLVEGWLASLVSGTKLVDVTINDTRKNEEPVVIRATTEGGRWLQRRGDEYVVLPLGREAIRLSPLAATSRRTAVLEIGTPWIQEEHFELMLPAGYVSTNVEEGDVALHEEGFGHFHMRTQWDAATRTLRVDALLRVDATRIAPEDYARFRTWTQAVDRAANEPFIFTPARAAKD